MSRSVVTLLEGDPIKRELKAAGRLVIPTTVGEIVVDEDSVHLPFPGTVSFYVPSYQDRDRYPHCVGSVSNASTATVDYGFALVARIKNVGLVLVSLDWPASCLLPDWSR